MHIRDKQWIEKKKTGRAYIASVCACKVCCIIHETVTLKAKRLFLWLVHWTKFCLFIRLNVSKRGKIQNEKWRSPLVLVSSPPSGEGRWRKRICPLAITPPATDVGTYFWNVGVIFLYFLFFSRRQFQLKEIIKKKSNYLSPWWWCFVLAKFGSISPAFSSVHASLFLVHRRH